jgi:hypothetical protein
VVEFCERVHGKIARQRMERRDRAQNTTAKRKLMSRWITGLWVGMVERTGEHIIVSETI